MRKQVTAALMLGLGAAAARADIVELAPDLYLVVRLSRAENEMEIKVGAINEANRFATGTGRVAVPITGRLGVLGPLLKMYEYQFRVMTREEALAARPTLSEAALHVNGPAGCAPATTALMHDLHRVPTLAHLDPLRRIEPPPEEGTPPPESPPPEPELKPPTPPTPTSPPSSELPGPKPSAG
jgi:hypothetical protein